MSRDCFAISQSAESPIFRNLQQMLKHQLLVQHSWLRMHSGILFFSIILLISRHPAPGMYKNPVNSGINYQPQLFFSKISRTNGIYFERLLEPVFFAARLCQLEAFGLRVGWRIFWCQVFFWVCHPCMVYFPT